MDKSMEPRPASPVVSEGFTIAKLQSWKASVNNGRPGSRGASCDVYFDEEELFEVRCTIKNERLTDFFDQLNPSDPISAKLLEEAEDLAFDLEVDVKEMLAKFGAAMDPTKVEGWKEKVTSRNTEVWRLECELGRGVNKAKAEEECRAGYPAYPEESKEGILVKIEIAEAEEECRAEYAADCDESKEGILSKFKVNEVCTWAAKDC